MHKANCPIAIKYKVFPKAFMTATLLDGLVIVEVGGEKKTHYEHFYGNVPKFAKHVCTWGEAGTSKTHKKTTPKIADRGVTCMFVRYTIQHEGNCYKMLDPRTSIPKPVNKSYTDNNDLLSWPEHMNPEVNQLIKEEKKAEEADANEDEVVDASKGENGPKSEMPVPTTAQSGCVTKLPQYPVDNTT
eukprot:5722063-Ditylum_brightwellii.AAC.1